MIETKDILADLHVHTISSVHAYSTVTENINEAQSKNLSYLAITDHLYSFERLQALNEVATMCYMRDEVQPYYSNINLINGCEMNVNQNYSNYLVEKDLNKIMQIPWRLMGTHSWFLDTKNSNPEDTLNIFYKSASKYKPTAFAHIERELEVYSYKDARKIALLITDYALNQDVVLEINESSLSRKSSTSDITIQLMREWVSYAKNRKALFSLGSDAHYHKGIGVFNNTLTFLNDIGIDKSRIVNCDAEYLKQLSR